ncbi:MAG: 50S ribosomal protein L30 [Candidatus Methanofastidiosa archaeon]|nr:50S ribosomal protein L30 [Candidatus Methanofastidiosa archaeon]
MKRLAVVRIRGTVGVRGKIADTLKMLNLEKVSTCVVIDDRDSYTGMLQKAKDYITFGEIDAETLKKLILKWGRLPGGERITEAYVTELTGLSIDDFVASVLNFEHELSELGIKSVFRLHPPRGGYEDIRKGYGQGGSLGNRGTDMVAFIEKMM